MDSGDKPDGREREASGIRDSEETTVRGGRIYGDE